MWKALVECKRCSPPVAVCGAGGGAGAVWELHYAEQAEHLRGLPGRVGQRLAESSAQRGTSHIIHSILFYARYYTQILAPFVKLYGPPVHCIAAPGAVYYISRG